jgi:hypothetical protein
VSDFNTICSSVSLPTRLFDASIPSCFGEGNCYDGLLEARDLVESSVVVLGGVPTESASPPGNDKGGLHHFPFVGGACFSSSSSGREPYNLRPRPFTLFTPSIEWGTNSFKDPILTRVGRKSTVKHAQV